MTTITLSQLLFWASIASLIAAVVIVVGLGVMAYLSRYDR